VYGAKPLIPPIGHSRGAGAELAVLGGGGGGGGPALQVGGSDTGRGQEANSVAVGAAAAEPPLPPPPGPPITLALRLAGGKRVQESFPLGTRVQVVEDYARTQLQGESASAPGRLMVGVPQRALDPQKTLGQEKIETRTLLTFDQD